MQKSIDFVIFLIHPMSLVEVNTNQFESHVVNGASK